MLRRTGSSHLLPTHVGVDILAAATNDVESALEQAAECLGARPLSVGAVAPPPQPARRDGELTVASVASVLAAVLPEGTIFVDEGVSAAGAYLRAAATCPPFTYLALTGGSLGHGLPCAAGAAIACPDRKVVAFVGDGAALYTIQALYTHAREGLNVISIILCNDGYKILDLEMERLGTIGPRAKALTDLREPRIKWTELAHGLGLPVTSVDNAEALTTALRRALSEDGPHVIPVKL